LPENTKFICVFRNPSNVISSVLKECNSVDYLKEFFVNKEISFQLWYNSYRHLLDFLSNEINKKVLFVSYEKLINSKCIDEISVLLNATINRSFIEPSLNRTESRLRMPLFVQELYEELQSYCPC
jgi:hypothetical protein